MAMVVCWKVNVLSQMVCVKCVLEGLGCMVGDGVNMNIKVARDYKFRG
jgi:hypothetical protein